MNKLLILLLFFPALLIAQTFTRPAGTVIGNQTVISIPVTAAGILNKQALVYLPDDYSKTKKNYPLFLFLHGAGEAGSMDINQINNTGLPQAISQGLKPYGIDPLTGDTIKWIIISPHCTDNSSCSYAYFQLVYMVPYLLKQYRVDTTCLWVGGLSAGGSATFSVPMADSTFGAKFAGIMPESNGGWDVNINIPAFKNNLITWAKKGGATLYIVGNQDPGYNYAYNQYGPLIKSNSQPGKYYDSFPAGLAHVAQVWQQPWPLTARVWSKSMNAWTQMWSLRKRANIGPIVPKLVAWINIDSSIITSPNSLVCANADSSKGQISSYQWLQLSGPTKAIFTSTVGTGMVLSGLFPGIYSFELFINDSIGNVDSAFVTVKVNSTPLPPPRRVTNVQLQEIGGMYRVVVTYSDGIIETL